MWGMEWSLDDFEGPSHPEDHMNSREVEDWQEQPCASKAFTTQACGCGCGVHKDPSMSSAMYGCLPTLSFLT